jgi:hypothetical protein
MEAKSTEKRKRSLIQTYDAPWRRFYEMTKDVSGVLISVKYKVKNYKINYRYIIPNSLSRFRKYIDKYWLKNHHKNM